MTTKHTPGPWHYIDGAVYARPADAEDTTMTAIAMRCSQKRGDIAEQFSPTEKDANMRLIAAAPDLSAALAQAEARARVEAAIYRAYAEIGNRAANEGSAAEWQMHADLWAAALAKATRGAQ